MKYQLLLVSFAFPIVFLAFLLTSFTPSLAHVEQTFIVNTIGDSDDGNCDSDCTLREAVNAANNTNGVDTITFDLPDNSVITLGGSQLTISDTVTLAGETAVSLTIGANNQSRVFEITTGTAVTLSQLTIRDGYSAIQAGGGILNDGTLTINHSTIMSNATGSDGGGIYSHIHGTLLMNNSTIKDNEASSAGGGIFVSAGSILTLEQSHISHNSATVGGGLFSDNDSIPNVNHTTFEQNSANFGGGIFSQGGSITITHSTLNNNTVTDQGGGFYNDANATVTNSTFSQNSADEGGGIFSIGQFLRVYNSTLNQNIATTNGGGIHNADTVPLWLLDSIIANSQGGDCTKELELGVLITQYNLITDSGADACGMQTGVDNNLIGQLPMLGSLADNGGHTQTHALLTNSPALNAGDCSDGLVVVDQRGISRPQGSACDIGAFEVNLPVAVDDTVTTLQNVPVAISVLENDAGDSLVLDDVTLPGNGVAMIDNTQIIYTPTQGFVGEDSFGYIVSQGILTDTAIVTITVSPISATLYLPLVSSGN